MPVSAPVSTTTTKAARRNAICLYPGDPRLSALRTMLASAPSSLDYSDVSSTISSPASSDIDYSDDYSSSICSSPDLSSSSASSLSSSTVNYHHRPVSTASAIVTPRISAPLSVIYAHQHHQHVTA
ncbi:hypothetical protein RI367_003395 [Sorochytrium milnesiophthora]